MIRSSECIRWTGSLNLFLRRPARGGAQETSSFQPIRALVYGVGAGRKTPPCLIAARNRRRRRNAIPNARRGIARKRSNSYARQVITGRSVIPMGHSCSSFTPPKSRSGYTHPRPTFRCSPCIFMPAIPMMPGNRHILLSRICSAQAEIGILHQRIPDGDNTFLAERRNNDGKRKLQHWVLCALS